MAEYFGLIETLTHKTHQSLVTVLEHKAYNLLYRIPFYGIVLSLNVSNKQPYVCSALSSLLHGLVVNNCHYYCSIV